MWDYGRQAAGWPWWAWLLMLLGTAIFWVAVAWFVRSVLQDPPRADRDGSTRSSEALRVLDDRLARGEITLEEHHRVREVLLERRR